MKDKTKALTFDKETVDKVGKAFEVITRIEILSQGKEGEEQVGTEGRNWHFYKDIGENAICLWILFYEIPYRLFMSRAFTLYLVR
jgi:hypothetical protein